MSQVVALAGMSTAQRNGYSSAPDGQPAVGRTALSPIEEERFQAWARGRGIDGNSSRDYRSLWKYGDPKASAVTRRKKK